MKIIVVLTPSQYKFAEDHYGVRREHEILHWDASEFAFLMIIWRFSLNRIWVRSFDFWTYFFIFQSWAQKIFNPNSLVNRIDYYCNAAKLLGTSKFQIIMIKWMRWSWWCFFLIYSWWKLPSLWILAPRLSSWPTFRLRQLCWNNLNSRCNNHSRNNWGK